MFNIRILGLSELLKGLTGIKEGLAGALEGAMREAAFLVNINAQKQITTGPNRAIKTGFLKTSIAVSSVLPYQAKVQAYASYGIYVHEGTRYMRARPFLAAGLKDSVPEIEKIFGRRVQTLIETI